MGPIDRILGHEISRWVIAKTNDMTGRPKFSAQNAIQYLLWSEKNSAFAQNLSSFCAMHATEEAVASFVSAAEEQMNPSGKNRLNLNNHKQKALVSHLAQRFFNSIEADEMSMALDTKADQIVLRLIRGGQTHYLPAHLNNIHYGEPDGSNPSLELGALPQLEDVREETRRQARIRNDLLYADNQGLPGSFAEPEKLLERETQLTLGLVWAAYEVQSAPGLTSNFVEWILGEAVKLRLDEAVSKPM